MKGSVECPYGTIEIEYQRIERDGKDDIGMTVTVPTSTMGFLLLPKDESEVDVTRLQERGREAFASAGTRAALKSGKYCLVLRP